MQAASLTQALYCRRSLNSECEGSSQLSSCFIGFILTHFAFFPLLTLWSQAVSLSPRFPAILQWSCFWGISTRIHYSHHFCVVEGLNLETFSCWLFFFVLPSNLIKQPAGDTPRLLELWNTFVPVFPESQRWSAAVWRQAPCCFLSPTEAFVLR